MTSWNRWMHVTGNPSWQHFMSAVILTVFHITWVLDNFTTFSWNQALSTSDWAVFEAFQTRGALTQREICHWLCFSSYSLCILLGILLYENYVIPINIFPPTYLTPPDRCDDSQQLTAFTGTDWQLLFFVVQYLTGLRPHLDRIYFSVGPEWILVL